MALGWCGQDIEGSFGPIVRDCRGGFDFTVFFEQLFLSIIPSAAFLTVAPFRIWRLYKASPKARAGWLLPSKILVATTYFAIQIYLLVRWTSSPPFHVRSSTAAAAVSLASSLTILILSPLEHLRCLKPSTVLQIYFLLTFIFDIATCRTLWLIGLDAAFEWIFTLTVTLKLLLFSLEVVEKRRYFKPQYRHLKAETTSGFVNLSVFWWLNQLFITGYRKALSLADIEGLEESHRAEVLEHNIQESWAKSSRQKPSSLLWTLAWTLRWSLAASVLPRLCAIGFKLSQPFLIGSLISYLDSPVKNANIGNGLIGAFVLVYSGVAISTGFYWYNAYRTITMVRGSLIAMVYSSTLNMASNTRDRDAPSALMSTDVERICTCLINLHELWANIIEVFIAIFILERQIGAACISPAILAFVCGAGTLLLTSSVGKRQESWLKAVQRRLRVTESTLSSIKSIKMMAITEPLERVIQDLRVTELLLAIDYRKLQVASIIISLVMNITGPAVTLTTFSVISAIKGHGTLLAAPAFTSIAVLSLIGTPLITLFQALPLIKSAIGSMTRIQDFLNQPGYEDSRTTNGAARKVPQIATHMKQNNAEVEMQVFGNPSSPGKTKNEVTISAASIRWPNADVTVLHNIDVVVPHGSLTMIIGPVGCGKSTLIKAILGEMIISEGAIDISCREIAFCDQSPWLTYGTVRENITAMAEFPFDEAWFMTVIHACALERDFEQLSNGDQSVIGSRGLALSGGQQQRVSLARALYSRKKLAVFDDIFSGLDSNTEDQIFTRVFGPNGLLRKHGVTAILVTHRIHRLPFSSQVVVIAESGRIEQQGDFKTLSSTDGYVQSLMISEVAKNSESDEMVEERQRSVRQTRGLSNSNEANDLARQTGDLSLYIYYLRFAGFSTVFLAFGVLAVYSFCLVFPTIWLDWWSTANEQRPGKNLGMYLGVYILFGVVGLIGLSLFCWQMIIVLGPRAGQKLHSTVLRHALWASLSYLSKTDMGTIMNHFSQDMQLLDFQVTLTSMSAAEAFSTAVFRLVVVCVTAKYVAAIIPFTLGVVYIIQKGYLRTSRQLRYIDLEAKAPIYTLFLETLDGLATIRAFGWVDHLKFRSHELLDGAQKPFYLLNCIQRWLGLVLDMLLTVVSVLVVVFAVKFNDKASGGTTGVALVNVLTCHQHLAGFVLRWTLLETSVSAVSRIRAFSLQCPVEIREDAAQPPSGWPSQGAIELQNVSAFYNGSSPVLRNVTLSVSPGSRLGICGRTGSGKSSLILCLLQLLETSDGRITIDGLDLSHYSKEDVRSAFITVPQDPILFEGSVRFNLDPRCLLNDAEINDALRKVHLGDIVTELDSTVDVLHLSHGQRQLFALARAMLSKGKILILDEAASSVDRETNQLMQSLIRSEFASHTVICVEHHLENILDYDKIAVFDGGCLVECDTPDALLHTASKFKQLIEG